MTMRFICRPRACRLCQLLSMLPYVATIVVLALIAQSDLDSHQHAVASLGKPFYRARDRDCARENLVTLR